MKKKTVYVVCSYDGLPSAVFLYQKMAIEYVKTEYLKNEVWLRTNSKGLILFADANGEEFTRIEQFKLIGA